MDDRRRDMLGELLEQALALPPVERPGFVRQVCAGDAALRDELTSLLAAADTADDWLASLADAAARTFAAAPADEAQLTPGARVAHYEILACIGGGMGVVYKARDLRLHRNVALKFLPQRLAADAGARERLHVEARTASALEHPNIGVVHEIGEAGAHGAYIALAWYDGETLKERLTQGPLSVDRALDIVRQVARALDAAHGAGIVHRDVKPSNIICTRAGVRLLDFGIAKVAGTDLTREGIAAGTVAYMSPEQTRASEVDARSDLWSLGVVLYEMLTGQRPFSGASDAVLIHAIREDAPVPLRALRPDVPPWLAAVVDRCLARDPDARYPSAASLLDDLEAASAAPHARAGRSPRQSWTRTAAALAIAAVVALAAYLFGTGAERGVAAAGAVDVAAVAVLPFENRSGAEEDRYFTDGLHDEIRGRLSALSSLRVSSRTSVMQYRDTPKNVRTVADELGVAAVLEGSVLRAGDRVRVYVELIDARTDSPMWSETYDRTLDANTLFEIQREIAYHVADALRAELTPQERARAAHVPTTNLEAYRHYLLGRHHWNRRDAEGMDSALVHYEHALRLDPLYAAAYAGIADVHVLGYGPAGLAGQPLALAAARRAVELDPELAPAHTSLGMALTVSASDWAEADRAFRRSIELDPSYATAHQWYAEYLVTQGRMDEALAEARTAEELDPLSLIISWNRARIMSLARRHDDALAKLRAMQPLYRTDPRVNILLGTHLLAAGERAEAAGVLEAFGRALEAGGGDSALAAGMRSVSNDIRRGRDEALVELLSLGATGEGHGNMFRAAYLAHTGRHDEAIDLLERVHADRRLGISVPDIAVGEMFDPLRDDPRFERLLHAMNLDPAIGRRLRDLDRHNGRLRLQAAQP